MLLCEGDDVGGLRGFLPAKTIVVVVENGEGFGRQVRPRHDDGEAGSSQRFSCLSTPAITSEASSHGGRRIAFLDLRDPLGFGRFLVFGGGEQRLDLVPFDHDHAIGIAADAVTRVHRHAADADRVTDATPDLYLAGPFGLVPTEKTETASPPVRCCRARRRR